MVLFKGVTLLSIYGAHGKVKGIGQTGGKASRSQRWKRSERETKSD